jgi:hypothetical protein
LDPGYPNTSEIPRALRILLQSTTTLRRITADGCVIKPLPKNPPVRLNPELYTQLWTEVLRRDGWRCQSCGARTNLQVHHIQKRSQGGRDTNENLITLCAKCHHVWS